MIKIIYVLTSKRFCRIAAVSVLAISSIGCCCCCCNFCLHHDATRTQVKYPHSWNCSNAKHPTDEYLSRWFSHGSLYSSVIQGVRDSEAVESLATERVLVLEWCKLLTLVCDHSQRRCCLVMRSKRTADFMDSEVLCFMIEYRNYQHNYWLQSPIC